MTKWSFAAAGFVLAALPIVAIVPLFVSADQSCPNLTRSLVFGSTGVDVVALQNFLIAQNDLSAGNNTGYFGVHTQAAVQAFQNSNAIVTSGTPVSTGYGVVGPRTRGVVNQICRGVAGIQISSPVSSPVATSTNGTNAPLIINFEFGTPVTLTAGQTATESTEGFWGVEINSINTTQNTADVTVTPCMSGCLQNAYTTESFVVMLNQPHPFGYFSVAESYPGMQDYFGTVTLMALTTNTATLVIKNTSTS
jgi:peptidoglycan hydrolase-like protein with peptidoglycan-binding domain